MEDNLGTENTFKGSAGFETVNVKLKNKKTKTSPKSNIKVAISKEVLEMESNKFPEHENKRDCFKLEFQEQSKVLDKEQEDETHSYSTGSVVSLSSDEAEENFYVENQQVEGNEVKFISNISNPKKSHTSHYEITNDAVLAQQIEQSKRFFKNFSKIMHENNVDKNFNCVTEMNATPMPETRANNDSPKAISLISCSDDSFQPIRPTGKKRPKMFEDTDSEIEQEVNDMDEFNNEREYKIHFKQNHERKAKRMQLDVEQSVALPKESKSRVFVSDFDQMLQKKRKQKFKSHIGRRLDFIRKNDDLIEQLIDQMEDAAYEDRCLNEQGLPATKKVAMLKFVASQLIKKDLQPLFLEHNILSTLAEWLSPLPSKCLPCLQIREGILHILEDLPTINSALLKESGIGKALMFLCKHPEETKKNRESCRRLIAQWARPIYNLTCDYRAMSKAERQERDIELSTRYKKQVADKSSKGRQPAHVLEQALCGEEAKRALRPGEHGWVPRARVPQPSTKDYVHRPQSQLSCQLPNRSKPQPNRYEALAKKHQNAKRTKGAQHSKVGLSIFGSKV